MFCRDTRYSGIEWQFTYGLCIHELNHILMFWIIEYMAIYIWPSMCSGNSLFDGSKPLPEQTGTYHQRCLVAFNWAQVHRNLISNICSETFRFLPLLSGASGFIDNHLCLFNSHTPHNETVFQLSVYLCHCRARFRYWCLVEYTVTMQIQIIIAIH